MPKLTALVTSLILERPLCFKCLSEKSGASRTQVAIALRDIEGTLVIHLSERRCHGCGDVVEAVSLDRPSN